MLQYKHKISMQSFATDKHSSLFVGSNSDQETKLNMYLQVFKLACSQSTLFKCSIANIRQGYKALPRTGTLAYFWEHQCLKKLNTSL
jgi:hypothetical protein